MSYILDALKKSDQERRQNHVPTLQTINRPSYVEKKPGLAFELGVFFTGAIVLIAITAWWYQTSSVAEFSIPKLAEPVRTNNVENPLDINPVEKSFSEESINVESAGNNKKIDTPIVELWELPDPIRKTVPSLTFSFHVYSSNPERRTIIINKRRVREGDTMENGLLLNEITEEGAILQWNNRRFYINVVENW